jgi:uncharacterized protein (TIGR03086 family)
VTSIDTPINTSWPVLDAALTALQNAVAGVPAAAWDRPTPCEQWTVRQVVEHAAGDQHAWASTVGSAEGPSYNPFAPSGAEAGTAVELVTAALRAAGAAWTAVSPDAAETPTPLPQGTFPPAVAAAACALDAAVHAWDVAVATGQPSPLSDELAAQLQPAATAIAEPLRAYGVFAAVVPGPDSGPDSGGAAATLLRFLGRDPNWTAA